MQSVPGDHKAMPATVNADIGKAPIVSTLANMKNWFLA
jgi:hypothetical protein